MVYRRIYGWKLRFTCFFYRGNEKCKDTSRENDKHSVNLAASSIAPTTFNLAIDTLEVTFYFYFSEE